MKIKSIKPKKVRGLHVKWDPTSFEGVRQELNCLTDKDNPFFNQETYELMIKAGGFDNLVHLMYWELNSEQFRRNNWMLYVFNMLYFIMHIC